MDGHVRLLACLANVTSAIEHRQTHMTQIKLVTLNVASCHIRLNSRCTFWKWSLFMIDSDSLCSAIFLFLFIYLSTNSQRLFWWYATKTNVKSITFCVHWILSIVFFYSFSFCLLKHSKRANELMYDRCHCHKQTHTNKTVYNNFKIWTSSKD